MPAATASVTTLGKPSQSDEETNTSNAGNSAATSEREPAITTRFVSCSSFNMLSTSERSGPSPMTTNEQLLRARATMANARSKVAGSFCVESLVTVPTTSGAVETPRSSLACCLAPRPRR